MWNFLGVSLGLITFFAGLRIMSSSLAALGTGLTLRLERATRHRYQSFALGFLVTSVVQSSSAVNVMTIGLVNGGLLDLEQAFAVMLGANVGTTITAQFIALPLSEYGFYILAAGAFLWLFRCQRTRTWSRILIGIGAVFYGLQVMQQFLAPLGRWVVEFLSTISLMDNPLGWILVGAGITAVMQSSSVVTGITVVLVESNVLSGLAGICIALGSNIGTVVTTLIASIGLSPTARKAALSDLLFNVSGVICIYPAFTAFYRFIQFISPSPAVEIANAHTFFNLFTALLALPILPGIVALVDGK